MKVNLNKAALSLALSSILTLVSVSGPVSADTVARDSIIYSTFDSNWFEHHQYHAENVIANGATPLITWMPYKRATPDANIFQEIIGGKQDRYINGWLTGFQSWLDSYPAAHKPKISLRFAHQLRGEGYPWGNEPEVIKAAWRYLHTKFVSAGVSDSVDWVWSANTNDYPGDDVVDWLSIDDYKQPTDPSFGHLYKTMITKFPNKPVMLANGQDASLAADKKEKWISRTKNLIKQKFPAIKSIALLDTKKKLGWAFNLKDELDSEAADHAVGDDYLANTENTSATVQTEKAPVEILSSKGTQEALTLDTNSIEQTIKPVVVGSEVLAREARGIKKMSKAMLRKWRLNDILPR